MSDTVSKEFVVYGMSCMGCVRGVTGAVGKVAGVRAVDVSLEESCATVEYDPSAVDPSRDRQGHRRRGIRSEPALSEGLRRIGRGGSAYNPGPAGCSAAR